jgi:hypothetical protein
VDLSIGERGGEGEGVYQPRRKEEVKEKVAIYPEGRR